ncbi:cell division control protein Cdc6 [Metschnikowia bicuspidata]|uniref:Cell division control protein n=1 Tax=Metschnikowia bicuspidata TaxID=27322 RepID=A0A4P9ZHQ4_9ASCO|nr:cell division control protein Cdc6 [Metschnikowia bicuspidata]
MNRKRSCEAPLAPSKRPVLAPLQNQLATPPTTPNKDSVVDLSSQTRPRLTESVYSKAKALFQRGTSNGAVECLVGRETEAAQLRAFLETSVAKNACNSLYISGPPGTGKTAQTNMTLDWLARQKSGFRLDGKCKLAGRLVKIIRLNCMTVSKPENVFHELYNLVTGKVSARKRLFDDFYELLCTETDTESIVVFLDEMDYLITKDQQVLFQLFHCASHLKTPVLQTKLVVVGISNALDLTDKFLPRLRSNGFKPETLQFLPYTSDQIRRVVTSKLASLAEQNKENAVPAAQVSLMHPAAVQMCCKKCASITGDLRKAFDICYKSIELVEQQARKMPNFAQLTMATAPKVLLSHVARVCSLSFGDTSQQKITALSLLQKVVLCCLFDNERHCSAIRSPITVNELYEFYSKVSVGASENLLGKLKKGEFLEIISGLDSSSAVILATAKSFSNVDIGKKLIRPNVPYVEVLKATENQPVLSRILHASL